MNLKYYIRKMESDEIPGVFIKINEGNKIECQQAILDSGIWWNGGQKRILFKDHIGFEYYGLCKLGFDNDRIGMRICEGGLNSELVKKGHVMLDWEDLKKDIWNELFDDLWE